MDFTDIKLGIFLSSPNSIIKRNALSILKQLQKDLITETDFCRQCGYEKAKISHLKQNGCTILMQEDCPECDYHWKR